MYHSFLLFSFFSSYYGQNVCCTFTSEINYYYYILLRVAPVGRTLVDVSPSKQSLKQFPGNGEALDNTEDNMKLGTFLLGGVPGTRRSCTPPSSGKVVGSWSASSTRVCHMETMNITTYFA